MRFLRIVSGGMALAVAPLLLLQGLANARLPGGPVNWNGFWEADLGRAFLQVEETNGSLQIAVSDIGLDFARSAFDKEPFATDALFLFLVDARMRDENKVADDILRLGLSLDKRNSRLGVIEMEQAILADDFQESLVVVDRLTTTSPRLIDDFVQPIVDALGKDDIVPVLRDALLEEPAWADAFWRAVPSSEQGVVAMYELRQQVDVGVNEQSDATLLAGLVATGNYSKAFAFWDRFAADDDNNEVGFIPSRQFAPIGWQSTVTGSRSFSEVRPGEFEIFIEDQTFGELARQLVRLEPGTYRFDAKIEPLVEAASLDASLQCVETGADIGQPQRLADTPEWRIMSGCEIHWLILSGTAWERRAPMLGSISEMALSRR